MTSLLHSPVVLRTMQALHLSNVARQLAYRATTLGRPQITCTRAGTTATFCVPDPAVWRATDTVAIEPILAEWLSHIKPGDVVYDVGAHYGVYSILAAARGARVFAFEPDRERHDVFHANRRANNVEDRVTLAPVALSDHSGHTSLYLGTGVAALQDVATDLHLGTTHLDVPLIRADQYAAAHGAPPPTVLKIDVEGYESAVLDGLGALMNGVRVVLCEIHPDSLLPGESVESIRGRLDRAGLVPVDNARLGTRHHVLAARRAMDQAQSA
jgi:FkbM family methyltransferase